MVVDGEAEDRNRSELLRRNQQVKAAANLAGNAGLALTAAGAGRWFFERLDGNAIFWLLAGAVLMLVSVKALTMLEAEI
ncbi:MAG TPA: hypothetical protein VF718_15070 [Allosphingosinicella sp.]